MTAVLPPLSPSLASLCAGSPPLEGRSGSDERRRSDRAPCALYALCHEISLVPQKARTARVRDLSASGLGLLMSRPLRLGAALGVELQTATGRVEARLRARVEHITWLSEEGCWLLGCQATG